MNDKRYRHPNAPTDRAQESLWKAVSLGMNKRQRRTMNVIGRNLYVEAEQVRHHLRSFSMCTPENKDVVAKWALEHSEHTVALICEIPWFVP